MCGILALLRKKINIEEALESLKPRGPDSTKAINIDNFYFGFQRLRINDLSPAGMQPFVIDDIVLICNGEIYNHSLLTTLWFDNSKFASTSDCEVIIHLYKMFGIKATLEALDGVFAFVLYDIKKKVLFACRDRIGVRPLFVGGTNDTFGNINVLVPHAFSSEAKALELLDIDSIKQVPPATYYTIHNNVVETQKWWNIPSSIVPIKEPEIADTLKYLLTKAVEKRLLCERPIGCLLSGGLDSSVIVSILAQFNTVNTYSIGFEESTDLIYARKVAKHFNTNHHEFIITYKEALEAIEEVIYAIESYDITTVRASVGMYLLSKKIKEKYPDTVIFSGEGSDEMLCGYLYFHYAPLYSELFKESRRLLSDIYLYDVLRADRCTAAHGLELRVPFLDSDVVKFCMELHGHHRSPIQNIEKYYLRKAFEDVLPHDIVWRKKEGMSDGIGGLKKPWYSFIQDYAESKISDQMLDKYCGKYPAPHTKESCLYYSIFIKKFSHTPITYHWMPKWQDTNDPSGRVLPAFNA